MDLENIKKEVIDTLARIRASVSYELTGHITKSEVIKMIHNKIKNCPIDIVELKMGTPSLREGWKQKTSSHATFKYVPTEMEDIYECEKKLMKL